MVPPLGTPFARNGVVMVQTARWSTWVSVSSQLLLLAAPPALAEDGIVAETPGEVKAPEEEVGFLHPGEVIVHSEPARVRFQTPTNGVSFWLKRGSMTAETKGWWLDLGIIFSKQGTAFDPGFGVYSSETHLREYLPICEGACEVTMPAGVHRIALSLDGSKPLEPAHPTIIPGPAIIEGRYRDRRALRITGWVIWGVGSVLGSMMMLLSLNDTEEPYALAFKNKAAFYAGTAITVVSFGVGIPLAAQKDKAEIDVYPLTK
jgi:hypothetical protein